MEKRFNKTPLSHIKFTIEEQINQATDQLVFFLMLKYMKDTFIFHYTITLIKILFQNANVTFVKASVFSMYFSQSPHCQIKCLWNQSKHTKVYL